MTQASLITYRWESHYFAKLITRDYINVVNLRADSEPLDLARYESHKLKNGSYPIINGLILVTNKPVTLWSYVVHSTVGQWFRNTTPNPFKFELPQTIGKPSGDGSSVLYNFCKGLMPDVVIDDYHENPMKSYYYWVTNPVTEEKEIEITDTLDLGEFMPPPPVTFAWSAEQPNAALLPEEMHHLIPCRANTDQFRKAYYEKLKSRASDFPITNIYSVDKDKEISIWLKPTGHITISFSEILKGANLFELQKVANAFFEKVDTQIQSIKIQIKCPRCGGHGILTGEPQLEGPGKAQLQRAYSLASCLDSNRVGRKKRDELLAAISALGKYCN